MSRWRPLSEYTPFAHLLVEYMWNHRPPLLPSELADQAHISRQMLSRILNENIKPDLLVIRALARVMDKPASQMFLLVGWTTPDDLLLTRDEAWDVVSTDIQTALDISEEERTTFLNLLHTIKERIVHPSTDDMKRDEYETQQVTIVSAENEDNSRLQNAASEEIILS